MLTSFDAGGHSRLFNIGCNHINLNVRLRHGYLYQQLKG
jgi:hypothetical protein